MYLCLLLLGFPFMVLSREFVVVLAMIISIVEFIMALSVSAKGCGCGVSLDCFSMPFVMQAAY